MTLVSKGHAYIMYALYPRLKHVVLMKQLFLIMNDTIFLKYSTHIADEGTPCVMIIQIP